MGTRLSLQRKLENFIGRRSDGKQNVYFQPPEGTKLVYPCIIYKRGDGDTEYANDLAYKFMHRYDVTLITNDPDSPLTKKLIREFPMIRHSAFFVKDNLNQDNYVLYY